MNIKEIEKMTGISKQNIRFYESNGLLKPKRNKDINVNINMYIFDHLSMLISSQCCLKLNVPLIYMIFH